MKYEVLINKDGDIRCARCNKISASYIKINNKDELIDYLRPIIICSSCLSDFIDELAISVSKDD